MPISLIISINTYNTQNKISYYLLICLTTQITKDIVFIYYQKQNFIFFRHFKTQPSKNLNNKINIKYYNNMHTVLSEQSQSIEVVQINPKQVTNNFINLSMKPKNRNLVLPTNQAIPISHDVNIVSLFGYQLATVRKIPDFYIKKLTRQLYPQDQKYANSFICLYKAIVEYMKIWFCKEMKTISSAGIYTPAFNQNHIYGIIIKSVVKCANYVNGDLGGGVKLIVERSDVKKKLIQRIFEIKSNQFEQKQSQNNPTDMFSSISLTRKQPKKRQTTSKDYGSSFRPSPKQGQLITFNKKNIVKNLKQQLKSKSSLSCIICDKQIKKTERIFQCKQCYRNFHYLCNPRKNNCVFCQLRNINPIQQVQQQLFVGILHKNTKRHQIYFTCNQDVEQDMIPSFLPNKDQKKRSKVQIRSLRIKQQFDPNSSYSVLFPDACTVNLNKKLLKQFQPLHKKSAIKFRQDEIIKVYKYLNKGGNYLHIVERFLEKQLCETERVETQNHLIGVYLIKPPIQTDQYMRKCKYYQFQESEILLKESLLLSGRQFYQNGDQQQQLTCQTQKISLICSLTLKKLVYPGRGIFCNHFHCFDILNFILLNYNSKIPRWQCPICKQPAYKFLIDPILKAIINLTNDKKAYRNKFEIGGEWTQIIINKNLKFKAIDRQGKQGPQIAINSLQTKQFYSNDRSKQPIIQIQDNKTHKKLHRNTICEISSDSQSQQKQQKLDFSKINECIQNKGRENTVLSKKEQVVKSTDQIYEIVSENQYDEKLREDGLNQQIKRQINQNLDEIGEQLRSSNKRLSNSQKLMDENPNQNYYNDSQQINHPNQSELQNQQNSKKQSNQYINQFQNIQSDDVQQIIMKSYYIKQSKILHKPLITIQQNSLSQHNNDNQVKSNQEHKSSEQCLIVSQFL